MPVKLSMKPLIAKEEIDIVRKKHKLHLIAETDFVFSADDEETEIFGIYHNKGNSTYNSEWIAISHYTEDAFLIENVDDISPIFALYTPDGYIYSRAFYETVAISHNGKEYSIAGGRLIPSVKDGFHLTPLIITPDGLEILH